MTSVTGFRRWLQIYCIVAACVATLTFAAGRLAAAEAAKAEDEDKNNPSYLPTPHWLPKSVPVPNADAADAKSMKPYTEVVGGTISGQNKPVSFDMLPIPGGKFMMGAGEAEFKKAHKEDKDDKPAVYDEGPQHEVVIEPFWMGKCEVTWEEYEQWSMGLDVTRRTMSNIKPSDHDKIADAIMRPTKPYTDMSFGMGKDGYPAICMTQIAAQSYCKWLSAKTGRYYRLPTEAEWEYACRAGTTTAYSWGDDPEKAGDYAWHSGNSDDKYHKIAQKKPNPWGLLDIHGNVAEWVIDQYVPDFYKQFAGKTTVNPVAWPTTEFPRVVRGGSWDDEVGKLRCAARTGSNKDWKMQDPQIPQSIWYLTDASFVGCRVIRPLKVPTAEEAKKFEPDPEILKEFQKAEAGKQ